MRVPGVKSIGYVDASSVPASFEIQAMAGVKPSVAGFTFKALTVIGDATLELNDSNDNNGSNQKAALSFVTGSNIDRKRIAFIVVTASGAKYLIGTSASVPAFSVKDVWSAPSAANNRQVSAELAGPVAWIKVEGVEATAAAGEYITFEDWRQIADGTYSPLGHTHTKADITDFEHRHDTDELDDEEFNNTQDNINQQLLELAYAGL